MYYNNNQVRLPVPKTFFKNTSIIFIAFLFGQFLFGILTLFIVKDPKFSLIAGNDPLFYIAPALTIASAIASSFISRQMISKLPAKPTLTAKLKGYQVAIIVRAALNEGATMLCITTFLIGENLLILVIAVFNIVYFISLKPSRLKLEEDLNLSYEDKAEMGI